MRCSYGFLIVPPRWLIGFGVRFRMVFLWFCKVSYGCNRPPSLSIGFGDRFRMVSYGLRRFRIVLIVPLVSPSDFVVVFVWFAFGSVRSSYGFNRLPRWPIGLRDRFHTVFIWLFCTHAHVLLNITERRAFIYIRLPKSSARFMQHNARNLRCALYNPA